MPLSRRLLGAAAVPEANQASPQMPYRCSVAAASGFEVEPYLNHRLGRFRLLPGGL